MNLDFSECKTKEDVEKVFKKHKKGMRIMKDFEKRVYEDKLEELSKNNYSQVGKTERLASIEEQ